MPTNDFLPFAANDTGTNLLTQAEYVADTQRPIGNQPGVARSKLVNKVLRQSSFVTSAIAQAIMNISNEDILDDGDVDNLADIFTRSIKDLASPLGVPIPILTDVLPAGHDFLDGGVITIADNPGLWELWGTKYGGNGTTTMGKPDWRGRLPLGRDTMGGTAANRVTAAGSNVNATAIGNTGGSQLMQTHNHPLTDPGHAHFAGDGTGVDAAGEVWCRVGSPNGTNPTSTSTTGITLADAGAGNSQNMPPVFVCNWMIRLG